MTTQHKLNTEAAAAYLGLRPNTLEVWRSKHRGPTYSKMGSRVLYSLADLEAFFTARVIDTMESRTIAARRK